VALAARQRGDGETTDGFAAARERRARNARTAHQEGELLKSRNDRTLSVKQEPGVQTSGDGVPFTTCEPTAAL